MSRATVVCWVRQEESTSSLEQASEKALQACAFDAAGRKLPRYRWHLGCILLKMSAISLRTGPEPTVAGAAVLVRWLHFQDSSRRNSEPKDLVTLFTFCLEAWARDRAAAEHLSAHCKQR